MPLSHEQWNHTTLMTILRNQREVKDVKELEKPKSK